MNRIIFTILTLLSFSCLGLSQNQITGTITSNEDDFPMIGVSVLEKGTNNAVFSDDQGNFSIKVGKDAILAFSYIGYSPLEEVVGDRSSINVQLREEAYQLGGVVVTAFGIEKDKKASGFSFSEVNGEELTQAREISVANQLVGKVAGLDITKPSNGPSGATRIVIRGLSQFQGENRPLIVIDGIPSDNSNIGSAGLYGGRDSGDGLSSLNADDIETITVLKGPSASSLYGSRAGNGVVLITTKKGKNRKGIGVEFTSNFTTESVTLLPNRQQEYGQGANGMKPTDQESAFNNWRSWGARLDGSMTPIFDGSLLPYSAAGQDDTRSYYKTGKTWTNTLSLVGGNEKVQSRLSFSQLANEGIVPEATYDRYTINLVTKAQLTDKLSIEGKVNYIQESADNRVDLTDNPSNPSKYFVLGPANLPHSVFQRTRDENRNPIYWSNNPFTLSPYWGPFENVNYDDKNRILGYVSAKWQPLSWLSFQGRVATDDTEQDFFNTEIDGTQFITQGAIYLDNHKITERNYDFLLNITKKVTKKIGLEVNAGAVRTDRKTKRTFLSGSGFINPGFLALGNMNVQNPGTVDFNNFRINGLYANALVSFNNYLYLDASVRNDFFSVLTNPQDPDNSENSILYSSAALSFVFSDALKMPEWLTFGKLRLGLGTSGFGQIEPYSQVPVFEISPDPKDVPSGQTVTLGYIQGNSYPNPILKPSRTSSFEIGTDLRFLRNRIGLDITYYTQRTDKHIFPSPLPNSTGYSSYRINAGEVLNRGIELMLNFSVIDTKDFRWNLSTNFSKNVNTVVELNDDTDQLILGTDRMFAANIVAQLDGQIGDIWGNVYDRNAQGQIIHDDDGLPVIAEDREILGNFNPDWYGGITSSFTYKDFSLSFIIDTKQGGEILSTTSSFGYLFGTHVNTLEGRDNPDFMITGNGVSADGETPNTTPARIDDYYTRIASISEENVFDASYIKFRQLTIGYTLPKKWLEKTPFTQLSLALVGRNLFFIKNGLDEIGLDPESIYTATGNDIGIEYAALPSTRSYGINLNVKF